MWQAISAIIFYLLFLLIVALLFLIWRESVSRSQKAQQALIDVAMKSVEISQKTAEAALKASEAAKQAVDTLHELAVALKSGKPIV